MNFLFENLIKYHGTKEIENTIVPNSILDNLKPGYGKRPYQIEAFQRYILFDKEEFPDKPKAPFHLLYNMATGSGKTLIMAGLILYLYEKGYRNFLFFVNSNNIIKKTRDNFLNQAALKYLFNEKIVINSREVFIKETDTFESADDKNINIKFTTINKLHSDLNNTRENSVTYEDFKNKKVVLIADEAHHLNSATKSGDLFGSWEGTVLQILDQSKDNLLLEFTATLDYDSAEILKKYQDKVIYKYDLAQFRRDKYSKEINLLRSYFDEEEKITQALILNLYRQELAVVNNIDLKPVILFKAKRTIAESEENKKKFHLLVDKLSDKHIDLIRNSSTAPVVQKAFVFFDSKMISSAEISRRLKSNFKFENCISANSDEEAEANQIRLNTLEDRNNPIRAIFAVQKLNEGWDVLNLFDIVRLYEGQTTGGSSTKIGSTTLSEAQLIGRGARYFPFCVKDDQDKFTRKYDDDLLNDLKVLEELYYHTKEDSRYISELKKALIETGIYEDDEKLVTKSLLLKTDFKKSDFYKTGQVIYNKRVPKNYSAIRSLKDLGIAKRNFEYILSSGNSRVSGIFNTEEEPAADKLVKKEIKLPEIPLHIKRYAVSQNPFFYYNNLTENIKCFPNLKSINEFITSEDYLGSFEIDFSGTEQRIRRIYNSDYLAALQVFLQRIEVEIKSNLTDYEGSEYIKDYVHNVFKDKEIKVYKGSERDDGQEALLANEPWYVYNANYGTSEEKAFVRMFFSKFRSIGQKFKNIYLIRNEREIKIIDHLGRAFEPDFVLFCKQKSDEELVYQVFIEPKGNGFMAGDKWKEDFLKKVKDDSRIFTISTEKYLLTGVPFYNNENENEFKKSLEETLNI